MTHPGPAAPLTLVRRPRDLRLRRVVLTEREWLTPHYVRVRVAGDDLRDFGVGAGLDDHVRLFFIDDLGVSDDQFRAAESREFTPLAWGDDWLDLEFVSHGDEGIAGVWGATAPIGAPIGVAGPRGSLHIEGAPDAWFLAGDESAVAQIRRYAAAIPAGASARIIVEVADAAHEVPIDSPVAVEYVHRDGAAPGKALAAVLDALGSDDRPAGEVFGFVAAQKELVPVGRALLLDRWGVPAEQTVIKGYWKVDPTEVAG